MISPADIQSIKQRFEIIGNSPQLNHAIQVAMQVASTDMTVLITGESGSGKESFSKIIHSLSVRKHGQFIAINCGAIPEGTIDSELFGHEKGSFTGATDARKGYFEVTNGGTIFLDEIGEMPLGTQARLLRVLENGDFIRVGSSKVQKTDVRVVAATNVNLLQAVQARKFREDLYYRLNTVPIFVPPLRERGDDIELLFRKFADDFSEKYRVKPARLTEEAKKVLLAFRWPGNIRQLKNIVEQISVLEYEREISADTLRNYLPRDAESSLPSFVGGFAQASGESFTERDLLYKVLFDMKKDMKELKQLVFELLSKGVAEGDVLSTHKNLFEEVQGWAPGGLIDAQTLDPNGYGKAQSTSPGYHNTHEEETEDVVDITHESADETLSLMHNEKEMIIKALKKNNNRRKPAADDLGISERTLYRKIKEYDIDG